MSITITLQEEDALRYIEMRQPIPINEAMNEFMRAFAGMRPSSKISLIKAVRTLTGWGLKEAKEYVETYYPPIGDNSL